MIWQKEQKGRIITSRKLKIKHLFLRWDESNLKFFYKTLKVETCTKWQNLTPTNTVCVVCITDGHNLQETQLVCLLCHHWICQPLRSRLLRQELKWVTAHTWCWVCNIWTPDALTKNLISLNQTVIEDLVALLFLNTMWLPCQV